MFNLYKYSQNLNYFNNILGFPLDKSKELVSFFDSIEDKKQKQYLLNKLRQNPELTTEQLKNIPFKKQEELLSKEEQWAKTINPKYYKWIAKLVKDRKINPEYDGQKIKELLDIFEKHQKSLQKKDINQYKDDSELFNILKPFFEKQKEIEKTEQEKQQIISNGTQNVYSDGKVEIIKVNTPEAAKILFEGAHWCVRYPETFKSYVEEGLSDFYLIKLNGKKVALTCPSANEIKDVNDNALTNPQIIREVYPALDKLFSQKYINVKSDEDEDDFANYNQIKNKIIKLDKDENYRNKSLNTLINRKKYSAEDIKDYECLKDEHKKQILPQIKRKIIDFFIEEQSVYLHSCPEDLKHDKELLEAMRPEIIRWIQYGPQDFKYYPEEFKKDPEIFNLAKTSLINLLKICPDWFNNCPEEFKHDKDILMTIKPALMDYYDNHPNRIYTFNETCPEELKHDKELLESIKPVVMEHYGQYVKVKYFKDLCPEELQHDRDVLNIVKPALIDEIKEYIRTHFGDFPRKYFERICPEELKEEVLRIFEQTGQTKTKVAESWYEMYKGGKK